MSILSTIATRVAIGGGAGVLLGAANGAGQRMHDGAGTPVTFGELGAKAFSRTHEAAGGAALAAGVLGAVALVVTHGNPKARIDVLASFGGLAGGALAAVVGGTIASAVSKNGVH